MHDNGRDAPMPVTLTIHRVPDDLEQYLRERAARNRRSVQRDGCLEHA